MVNNTTKTSSKLNNKQVYKYSSLTIEPKWQAKWESEQTYQPSLSSAKSNTSYPNASNRHKKTSHDYSLKESELGTTFYNLMMFPYPSAEGLHVGSMYAFGGADVFGRYMRMKGYSVLEPIGLDGFGIHSENHAIKTGTHPIEHAERTQKNFYRQLHAIGNSYAWENKLETYDPEYYRWTQWIFVQLFKSNLAYRKKSPVNYCPSCKTVLSDEQVIDGQCERCSFVVEKRNLEQWYFRITEYAERLLGNIKDLDWTEKVKTAQTNWIGKKEGININYAVEGSKEAITVFTTRPDTNFGATFIAIAPEHPLALKITNKENKASVEKYIKDSLNKSEIERQSEGKEKTGAFTGSYAINPLTNYKMPIWVSDFVLGGFGTGALVGVPGHDKRDFQFAQKFGLEIIRVVVGTDGDQSPVDSLSKVQEEAGKMINSGFLNGMNIHDATHAIMDYIEKEGYGKKEVTYHLRDWLISRQRYWGPPIPMIYCEHCAKEGKSWFTTEEAKKMNHIDDVTNDMAGWYPENNLPVKLPYLKDFKPLGTGKAPLASSQDFYTTTCPECHKNATRETDVSDTFLDSSWYFLRYLTTDLVTVPFPMSSQKSKDLQESHEDERKIAESRVNWLPVNMYIGGAEHSVLHLLYARFVTMALKDMGYVSFEEPFTRFYAHGLIIKDGAKMSKSKGNIINPDDYIAKYGADTLRSYLLFLGPFNQGGDFRDSGIDGMNRFLKRVWNLLSKWDAKKSRNSLNAEDLKMMHETIKGITEDLENLRYNTAISKLMIYYNYLAKLNELHRDEVKIYLQLMAPFAPHITEELWETLGFSQKEVEDGNNWSIHRSRWPKYDEAFLVEDSLTIAVQVNGKLRGTIKISADEKMNKDHIESLAREEQSVTQFLSGEIKKVIYIPGKILNFVVTA